MYSVFGGEFLDVDSMLRTYLIAALTAFYLCLWSSCFENIVAAHSVGCVWYGVEMRKLFALYLIIVLRGSVEDCSFVAHSLGLGSWFSGTSGMACAVASVR